MGSVRSWRGWSWPGAVHRSLSGWRLHAARAEPLEPRLTRCPRQMCRRPQEILPLQIDSPPHQLRLRQLEQRLACVKAYLAVNTRQGGTGEMQQLCTLHHALTYPRCPTHRAWPGPLPRRPGWRSMSVRACRCAANAWSCAVQVPRTKGWGSCHGFRREETFCV